MGCLIARRGQCAEVGPGPGSFGDSARASQSSSAVPAALDTGDSKMLLLQRLFLGLEVLVAGEQSISSVQSRTTVWISGNYVKRMDTGTNNSFIGFIGWVLSPALRWWWAVISGTASIAALFLAPDTGLTLTRGWMSLLVLGSSLLSFVVVSVVIQGWGMFRNEANEIRVLSANKSKNDFEAKILFVLSGPVENLGRAVLEIRRVSGQEELPFTVVRVVDETDDGNVMAIPLQISPTALREFNAHSFGVSDMRVKSHITFDRILELRENA